MGPQAHRESAAARETASAASRRMSPPPFSWYHHHYATKPGGKGAGGKNGREIVKNGSPRTGAAARGTAFWCCFPNTTEIEGHGPGVHFSRGLIDDNALQKSIDQFRYQLVLLGSDYTGGVGVCFCATGNNLSQWYNIILFFS